MTNYLSYRGDKSPNYSHQKLEVKTKKLLPKKYLESNKGGDIVAAQPEFFVFYSN